MNKKTTYGAIAVLAILVAFGSLVLTRREPTIELGPYQALGVVAAEETLKLVGDTAQIVVVAQDTSQIEMPALDAQLKAFQTTMRKKPKVTVVLEKIAMDAMTMMATGGRVPTEHFLKTIQKYPQAGAIVLFLGFPPLAPRDLESMQRKSSKIVVVAAYRPDYQQLLENRIIDVALVPRFDALPETAKKPQTLKEWFDQEYVILGAKVAAVAPR